MDTADLRWPEIADEVPDLGWVEVVTPLGAKVHVRANSPAWDLCTEWEILQRGRGSLCATNPTDWFDPWTLSTFPAGLVAEMYVSANLGDEFTRLAAVSSEARDHVRRLAAHTLEPRSEDSIAECLDIVRRLEARTAACQAALECLALADYDFSEASIERPPLVSADFETNANDTEGGRHE